MLALAAARGVVLVVDDNDDAVELVVEALSSRELVAIRARSVHEATILLRSVRCDALVTDYAMPGGDGLVLLRRVRSDPALERIVCMMVSGQADERVEREARSLGALWHPKPIDPLVLAREIADARAAMCGRAARAM